MNKIFLTAAWRKLIMVNYAIDPALLRPYLPFRTELDFRGDTCYVSLVGFMFLNTKLKGIRIPLHADFEEANLRFYVRFRQKGEWKRGTVFIKEIVPKPAIAFVANTIYGEKYETRQMKHSWEIEHQSQIITYAWNTKAWNSIKVIADTESSDMNPGSEEEFIAEHYWGLSKGKNSRTILYEVGHPKWQNYKVKESVIEVDFEDNYGPAFAFLHHQRPTSVFLAEGSEIFIRDRQVLT